MLRLLTLSFLLLPALGWAAGYQVTYTATLERDVPEAEVEISLQGERLPSKLVLHLNPERHLELASESPLSVDGDEATWEPAGDGATLRYRFVIDATRDNGRYDSRKTDAWAILRSDKLVPPISVTSPPSLEATAQLAFRLPEGWSSAAPYAKVKGREHDYVIVDPGRRLPRPKGWLILGEFAARQDMIAGTDVRVAAPAGQGGRLQDALAFLGWTLPAVKAVFPDFPERLLIVTADDPMWRGGLSGTRSLFMHRDRPLISGNRTSSLIHELVHVGTAINGGKQADWIVEGIAEYYAANILWRTGGMSDYRYRQTLAWKENWAAEADTLFRKRSSGPVTARAAIFMHRLDLALREASNGQYSIDDVARALARHGGRVSLPLLKEIVAERVDDAVDVDALIAELEGSGADAQAT